MFIEGDTDVKDMSKDWQINFLQSQVQVKLSDLKYWKILSEEQIIQCKDRDILGLTLQLKDIIGSQYFSIYQKPVLVSLVETSFLLFKQVFQKQGIGRNLNLKEDFFQSSPPKRLNSKPTNCSVKHKDKSVKCSKLPFQSVNCTQLATFDPNPTSKTHKNLFKSSLKYSSSSNPPQANFESNAAVDASVDISMFESTVLDLSTQTIHKEEPKGPKTEPRKQKVHIGDGKQVSIRRQDKTLLVTDPEERHKQVQWCMSIVAQSNMTNKVRKPRKHQQQDWFCASCYNFNYNFRSTCSKCNTDKPQEQIVQLTSQV